LARHWQHRPRICSQGAGDEEELVVQHTLPPFLDVGQRGPTDSGSLGDLALGESGGSSGKSELMAERLILRFEFWPSRFVIHTNIMP
jgi:hypothetical protein